MGRYNNHKHMNYILYPRPSCALQLEFWILIMGKSTWLPLVTHQSLGCEDTPYQRQGSLKSLLCDPKE